MMKKWILVILAVFLCIFIATYFSRYHRGTDFPYWYYVGNTILDPDVGNEAIYSSHIADKYGIPTEEIGPQNSFRYSVLAAFLFTPLALLPYFTAKSVMIFLELSAYIIGVVMILRMMKNSGRRFFYPLTLSCLWPPFLNSIANVQVNGILLLLIVAAILAFDKQLPYLSGVLFALASLFKLSPFLIAILFGLQNRRVLIGCTSVVILSFLIPGSLQWLHVLGTINPADVPAHFYTIAYQWFGSQGLPLFALYSGCIGVITAITVYLSRNSDSLLRASLGVLAAFTMMPVVEYHHLTVLILPYLHTVFSRDFQGWPTRGFLISSAIIIGSSMSGLSNPIKYLLVFLFWAFLALRISPAIPRKLSGQHSA